MTLIIFDFDGTLVDSKPFIKKCYIECAQKIKPELKEKAEKILIGPTLQNTILQILGHKNNNLFDDFFLNFKLIHDKKLHLYTKPFDGVEEILKYLQKKNILMSIATNKRELPTKKLIKYLKWDNYFINIISIDSYKEINNKTKIVSKIIKGSPKNDVFMIGDTLNDYKAAKENNIKFIKALWGYGKNDNWEDDACKITLKSIIDLKKIF